MRVLIIGGGKVGSSLARRLADDGHAVTVIERDEAKANRLGDAIACLVLHGDGTDVEILRSVDVDRIDWMLAVTGRDDVNLVAAELAEALGKPDLRVVARLNDPRNERTFAALGIRPVSVTNVMAQVIANAAEADVSRRVMIGELLGERLTLIDVEIPVGSPRRQVMDLDLPPDTVLVRVVRGDEVLVPAGPTEIAAGDRVLAVTRLEQEPAVHAALCSVDAP